MAFKPGTEKKKRKKKKKRGKKQSTDVIPEDLDNLQILTETETETVTETKNLAPSPTQVDEPYIKPAKRQVPPPPITFDKSSKKGVQRPIRLPLRFKNRLSKKQIPATKTSDPVVKSVPPTVVIPTPTPHTQTKPISRTQEPVKPPVTRRRRQAGITAPESISQKPPATQPPVTHISVEQSRLIHEEVTISNANMEITSSVESSTSQPPQSQSASTIKIDIAQDLILPQFNPDSILNRPQTEGWPWVKSKPVNFPQNFQTFWRAEASLYSAIATLEMYTRAYDRGEIAPEVYHKQLKAALMEAIQLRFKLEKDKRFNWSEFVSSNQIDSLYPHTAEKLRRVEGSSDIDEALEDQTHRMDYKEITRLPTKAADYVANAIELMDLIRLQSVATIERLIPLLEDLRKILQQTTNIVGEDYWAIQEINAWIQRLYQEAPGTIPSEEELERLEMQVVRWLNDFRRELKNLQ